MTEKNDGKIILYLRDIIAPVVHLANKISIVDLAVN
jgi:hypothetical protein